MPSAVAEKVRFWSPSSTLISETLKTEMKQARFSFREPDWVLEIPQVSASDYKQFKRIAEFMRGRYQTGGAYLFDFDGTAFLLEMLDSGYLPKKNPFQLHQTPPDDVDCMLSLIDVDRLQFRLERQGTLRVLEPSAGLGAIACRVREELPGATLDLYELDHFNRAALEQKGFVLTGADWLTEGCQDKYDLVLMNPEFRGNAYMKHILKAYDRLKEGGLFASVVPIGFLDSQTKSAIAFRDEVRSQCWQVEPIGSPFENTDIECLILYGERLSEKEIHRIKTEPHDGYQSRLHFSAEIALSADYEWRLGVKSTTDASSLPELARTCLTRIMAEQRTLLPASQEVCQQIANSTVEDGCIDLA